MKSIVLLLVLLAPVLGHTWVGYRVLPAQAPVSRGDSSRHLFDLALLRSNQSGDCALTSLFCAGGPAAGSLIGTASLWLVTATSEIQLSAAIPDSTGGLRFILGTPLPLASSSSNMLRIRASIRLFGSTSPLIAFTNTEADLVLSPPGITALSNLDHPNGAWPNTNAMITIHHRALAVTNEVHLVSATPVERGIESCIMAASLSAPLFSTTAAPVSLSRVTIQADAAVIQQISVWLDNDDADFSRESDTLLGTATTSGTETAIQLTRTLAITNRQRRIWVTAVPHPNATVGASLPLSITASPLSLSGLVSAVVAPTPVTSPAGLTVQDTRPPANPTDTERFPGYGTILLRWLVPNTSDLASFRVILSSGALPAGPLDTGAGQVFDTASLTPGVFQELVLKPLNPVTSYTATIWSLDSAGLWSDGTRLTSCIPNWYTNTLPPPSGVRVITSPDSWSVSWQTLSSIPVTGYRIRVADEESGIVFPLTDLVPGSSLKIRPAHLGIGSLPRRARLSVIAVDANATTSPNDFSTLGEAISRGIAVRTVDALTSGTISVWNTVFRAGDDRARIVLRISREDQAVVQILAVHGERLATLVNRRLPPGTHEFFWDGRSGGSPVKPGLYLIHVRAGDSQQVTRIIVRR